MTDFPDGLGAFPLRDAAEGDLPLHHPAAPGGPPPQDELGEELGPPSTSGTTRFGRGWIPADRDIGLPHDDLPAGAGCAARPRPNPSPEGEGLFSGDDAPFVSHRAWDATRKVRFLHYLADKGDVRAACARVGMSRQSAYLLRRRDGAFAQGWQAALVLARRHVEEVLATRAIDGVEESIWFRGELVGTRRRYDARLLLAHLARLDRLAEAPAACSGQGDDDAGVQAPARPADHAERFDEVLALIAGEDARADLPEVDPPEEMLERARAGEGAEQAIDPLRLPPVRAAYVLKTAEAALIEDNGAWHDICEDVDAEFEEQHHCLPDSEAASAFPAPEYPPEPDYADYHRASAARWDGWQDRAFGRVDAAVRGGEAADQPPMEYKSMDGPLYDPQVAAESDGAKSGLFSLDRVTCVTRRLAGGAAQMAGSAWPGVDNGGCGQAGRTRSGVNASTRRRIGTAGRSVAGVGNGSGGARLSV